MTVYKLTVNLDATLAVQNPNGSFHYFKPSIGAEFTTDDTEDLTILNKKFEDLYAEVIGPNFNSVVKEFLANSDEKEASEEQVDSGCNCTDGVCACKPLEIGEKPESDGIQLLRGSVTVIEMDAEGLPKEEWE